jgi:site-specific DNA recombinase
MEDFLRAALYARVSTDRQAQQVTVASQVAALQKRIGDDGLTLDAESRFIDNGFSGTTLVRPALERLRDVAYAGSIDRLYVHSPDRLARKYAYQVLLLEEFSQHGVEVIFLNQQGPTSPEQEMLVQMQGMFAEYERAKILERTRRGRRYAARRGAVSVLAGAPFGYRYVTKQAGNGLASYQIVADEARIVQDIFHWVGVEGLSLSAVARRLRQQGVATSRGNSRWDRTTLRKMLANPAYQGQAAWGKGRWQPRRLGNRQRWCGRTEIPREQGVYATEPHEQETIAVPALVSEELFAAVAQQLTHNRQRQRIHQKGARHLLQGLLICQVCQHAYCGRRLKRPTPYVYYRCLGTDTYRWGGAKICDNRGLNGPILEKAIWNDLCALLQNPQRLRQEFERRLERPADAVLDLDQREKTLSQLKRRIARLIDAYEHGFVDKEEFEPRVRQAKEHLKRQEKEYAQQQQAAADNRQLRLLIDDFSEFAQGMTASLEQVDEDTKRKIMGLLIKRIEVGRDAIRIVYKVTPVPFAQSPNRGVLQHCGKLPESSPGQRPGNLSVPTGSRPERAPELLRPFRAFGCATLVSQGVALGWIL